MQYVSELSLIVSRNSNFLVFFVNGRNIRKMKPGGIPIGEKFDLMIHSYVIFPTEQEYVIQFFLSQKTKILDHFY